jgi:hypothetical protein
MGRKGVSKRKPKTKAGPVSKTNQGGISNHENSPVQSLIKDKGAPLTRSETGSNKPQNKR